MELRGRPCGVCHEREARYTCPRCGIDYCSVSCYREHSTTCTESFFKDSAESELRSTVATEDERRGMADILRRLHEADRAEGSESTSGDESEDAATAAVLSEATARKLWERMQATGELQVQPEDLTAEELAAFHEALANGELGVVPDVGRWEPWWEAPAPALPRLRADGTALIAAIGGEEGAGREGRREGAASPGTPRAEGRGPAEARGDEKGLAPSDHGPVEVELEEPLPGPGPPPPPPAAPIARLRRLTGGREPHPSVAHGVAATMAAWALARREVGGADPVRNAPRLTARLLVLAPVLLEPTPPATARVALGALAAAASRGLTAKPADAARAATAGAWLDAARLLDLGRVASLLALEEAARAVERARGGAEGARREALRDASRKLAFYLAWANELPPEGFPVLAASLRAVHPNPSAGAAGAGLTRASPS